VTAVDTRTLGVEHSERRWIGTVTTASTAEQRRQALLELADLIGDEDHRDNFKLFTPVIDLWVPVTASSLCVDPIGTFNQLVGAISERQSFCNNETEYAVKNGHGTSDEALSNLGDKLQADVDLWADRLMGQQT
jgi:hypothetical protein